MIRKAILISAELLVSAASAETISLTWRDNSDNETGFDIERRSGVDGVFEKIGETEENVATFSDDTAQVGIAYSYRVRAFNHFGPSGYTNTVTHTVVDAKYFEPFEQGETPSGLNGAQSSNGNTITISAEL